MKILVIGDVTSPSGIEHLKRNLWKFREQRKIDFCIVNGENAAFVTGISPELAEVLLRSGADCISGGNHTLRNKRAYIYLDDTAEILRPINFGADAPGHGYAILDCNGYRILVINALGRVNMNPTLDSPFTYIDRLLQEESGRYDFAILDIHAEATGEKYREIARAMGVAGVDSMTQEEYRKAAVDAVKKLSQDVGIPADLKDIVKEEDLPFLAQSAFNDACRPGNPKETSVEDITALYKSLL